jgi:hypothetical protein
MSVSYAQHWRLRRIDHRTSRSDPHLAAMLAIFTRLSAGEPIASIEQAGFRHTYAWYNLSRMKAAALLLLIAYTCRAFRRIGKAVTHPRPGWEQSWLGYGTGHIRSRANEKYG